jgi:hypothetical protein
MSFDVYIEIGQKRTFAGGIDWPGWCRSGKDADSALQAILEHGPRYERVLQSAGLGFIAPKSLVNLKVVETLKRTTTTDFGAPDQPTASDARGVSEEDLWRYEVLLKACWGTFDSARQAAEGKILRKGPRGAGRDLKKIVAHVQEGDEAYLSRLGWKLTRPEGDRPGAGLEYARHAILQGLGAAVRGELAAKGPRGGKRWTPR